jgi:predicted ATP-binding protein involved in virulence
VFDIGILGQSVCTMFAIFEVGLDYLAHEVIIMRITSFGVEGLFGIFDHHIRLNQEERVTIIHGPNGFGKTTLLRLVRGFFSKDFEVFATTPFKKFSITLDDARVINIDRDTQPKEKSGDFPVYTVSVQVGRDTIHSQTIPATSSNLTISKQLQRRAPYVRFVANDVWQDTRDGELLASEELYERFHVRVEKLDLQPWLEELTSAVDVRLIATQRLSDSSPVPVGSNRVLAGRRRRTSGTSAVVSYAEQLSETMRNTFLEYADLSQQLDRTFVVRLLRSDFKRTSTPLPDNSLKSKIDNLNEKRGRLREAGLLSKDDQALPQPEAPYPYLEDIISAYLQDVEDKLRVFDKLLAKIELLNAIVKSRLQFKTMVFSQEDGFTFKTITGETLTPDSLSSGEQHILIQIYDLLFSDKPDSLILIDEPEISLHVAWQLSFIDGLRQITDVVPHDIVLATHSPQIIGDRWDLTVELQGPNASYSVASRR